MARPPFWCLTVGKGVYTFTLDPRVGEFYLQREKVRVPATTKEFAYQYVQTSGFWLPEMKNYVNDLLLE